MKRYGIFCAGLAAGFVGCALAAFPAMAGGYDDGPVVKHRVPAAVPVPAPIPVPDTMSNWYLRADAAYSFSDTSSYRAAAPFNDDAVRGDGGLDRFGRYGIGVGYHFARWLRADVTLDVRTEVNSRGAGSIDRVDGLGTMRDTYTDEFGSRNWTGLANVYFDMPTFRSVTPYVGAGLGMVVHTSGARAMTFDRTCIGVTLTCVADSQSTSAGDHNDIALAAAFMTGVSWKVDKNGSFDFGYRLLHLEGTTLATALDGGGASARIAIPDQNIHEIRVGYRVDIN